MNDLMIHYFQEVAKNRSFSKTAELLYVSQPAISKQIAALEEELGFPLFDRTLKPIKLTEAGEMFLEFVESSCKQLERLKEKAKNQNKERTGLIRIGCLEAWTNSDFFPKLLKLVNKDYPNITVRMETHTFSALKKHLEEGDLDMIVTIGVTLRDMEKITVKKLTDISQMIILSSAHPLYLQDEIKPEDLKDEMFFVPSDKEVKGVQEFVNEYCAPYGFVPRIVPVPNVESQINNVRYGLGVAITDAWQYTMKEEGFRHIPLGSKHEISLAWLSSNKDPILHVLANEIEFQYTNNK